MFIHVLTKSNKWSYLLDFCQLVFLTQASFSLGESPFLLYQQLYPKLVKQYGPLCIPPTCLHHLVNNWNPLHLDLNNVGSCLTVSVLLTVNTSEFGSLLNRMALFTITNPFIQSCLWVSLSALHVEIPQSNQILF